MSLDQQMELIRKSLEPEERLNQSVTIFMRAPCERTYLELTYALRDLPCEYGFVKSTQNAEHTPGADRHHSLLHRINKRTSKTTNQFNLFIESSYESNRAFGCKSEVNLYTIPNRLDNNIGNATRNISIKLHCYNGPLLSVRHFSGLKGVDYAARAAALMASVATGVPLPEDYGGERNRNLFDIAEDHSDSRKIDEATIPGFIMYSLDLLCKNPGLGEFEFDWSHNG